jgi:elongation factor P--beta-lysine ligase
VVQGPALAVAVDRAEAEQPGLVLQVSPGNEAHLSAFATQAIAPDGTTHPLYLHTSAPRSRLR